MSGSIGGASGFGAAVPSGSGGMRTDWPAREPGRGVGAVAVHPDLAGAAQLLDRALRQAGKVPAEPAIQADIGFVGGDDARGDGHGQLLSQETARATA